MNRGLAGNHLPFDADALRRNAAKSRQKEEEPKVKPKAKPPPRPDPPAPDAQASVPDVQDTDKIPHSDIAEQGVIGSMLKDPKIVIPQVAQAVSIKYFHRQIHATLFQALCDMWDSGSAVDLITFTQYLRDQQMLERVGGLSKVTDLSDFVPSAANVVYYIDIMREKYVLRRLYFLGFEISYAAMENTYEEPSNLLTRFTGSFVHIVEENNIGGFYDAATVLNGQMPALPRVVVHHLLHEGSKMILGGTSKSNKTWALMDLSISVTTGSDWWGFHVNKSRVCYINLEIQDGFFVHRLKAICEHKGVYPELGQFKILNLRGHAESIENLRHRFAMLLRSGRFGMVVIDPVYKVLGRRDENKAGDIATVLNEIERIAVETGAAVVFAAHYSKGNQAQKEAMDRIGGSGVFARDPDSVLTMTQHENLDCFTVDATLRNLSPISPFVVRWEYPLFKRDEEQDPGKLKGKGGAPQKWTENDILGEFKVGEGWDTPKLQKRLYNQRGMPRSTFYRLWEKLGVEDKIRVDSDGIWSRVSNPKTNSETNEKDQE